MSSSDNTAADPLQDSGSEPIDITPYVTSRYFVLPMSAAGVGSLIGAVRGSRLAGLRFLAENAHRPPTTIRGWYLYNKTKNYRRMAAALKTGGVDALRLGLTALVWVAIEDGIGRLGRPWEELRELGAGVGTAGVFAAVYGLRGRAGSRAVVLGGMIGGGMDLLRVGRGYLAEAADRAQRERDKEEGTS